MVKTCYTYRIRVANRDRVQVEKWDASYQQQGEPSGVFRYQEKLPEIASLVQAARSNTLNNDSQTQLLGETLFEMLFDEGLRQDFISVYYQVVQQQKQLLRVELDLDEQAMPEIAALPWEFMRVPTQANLGSIWIGTLPNLAFSRRRSQWLPAQPIQLAPDEKLRIAVVIAAPSNLSAVAYEPVQEALEQFAQKQHQQIELLPVLSTANPEGIDQILSQEPHIFHFIGHGRMRNETNQEVGEIALVDPNFNDAIWVNADYLSNLFNQHRPGVVLLQACEGGTLSSSQAFAGVASKIVQQNVPVVVAMQYEVTNSTASRFALKFYQQLATEDPVDLAAQLGRYAIALSPTQYRKRDFATPVLFMQVQDGNLFQWERSQPREKYSNQEIKEIEFIINQNFETLGHLLLKGVQPNSRSIYQRTQPPEFSIEPDNSLIEVTIAVEWRGKVTYLPFKNIFQFKVKVCQKDSVYDLRLLKDDGFDKAINVPQTEQRLKTKLEELLQNREPSEPNPYDEEKFQQIRKKIYQNSETIGHLLLKGVQPNSRSNYQRTKSLEISLEDNDSMIQVTIAVEWKGGITGFFSPSPFENIFCFKISKQNSVHDLKLLKDDGFEKAKNIQKTEQSLKQKLKELLKLENKL
jgi:hypothetical protein